MTGVIASMPEPITTTTRSASGAPWYSTSRYRLPLSSAKRSIVSATIPGTRA